MEMSNKSASSDFPLHNIKKVKIISDHYRSSPPDTESMVNQLLSKGWILLALHTEEVSPKEQHLIYTLGHTEVSADDSVKAIYETPEQFKEQHRNSC